MKKIISLMVALALFASTAFAAPISVAASLDEPVTAQTVSASASADIDALFSDVQAVALTDSEAQAIEGAGGLGWVLGGLIGLVGGFTTSLVTHDSDDILIGMGIGQIVGLIVGP